MKKFFTVGKNYFLLGTEIRPDFFKFTIGKTLSNQASFTEVRKEKSGYLIKKISEVGDKAEKEGMSLLIKILEKNFPGSDIYIDKNIAPSVNARRYHRKLPKFNVLTDVYAKPDLVPWNFVPTEIDEILSYFPKKILKDKRVLYIGAGYGKNIWSVQGEGYAIDAIEFSKLAVDRANRFFGKEVMIKQDLTDLKALKNKKYDIIIDIGCVHCIPVGQRRKAVKEIHGHLEDGGIVISRIFKPRNKKWLRRMPFKIKRFGLTLKEIKKLFSSFIIETKHQNKDFIIFSAKKC